MHENPQLVPSHVAVEFAGGVHAEQLAPQLLTLVLLTHAPEQLWKPPLQAPWTHTLPTQLADAFANEHTWPHAMQLFVSIVVFTSQPLPAIPSQFA